eukprot:g11334.t1
MSKPQIGNSASVRLLQSAPSARLCPQPTDKKEKGAKSRSRRSISLASDTPQPRKKCKRSQGCLDSTSSSHAWLLVLPVDLWCCIRDCIGWTKLVPLARVCKRLSDLVKDPEVRRGLEEPELDLSKFMHGSPLHALSEVWSASRVFFRKIIMDPQTTQDSVIELLHGIRVQHLCLASCCHVTNAGLAHLSALSLQHLNLNGCSEITDAGLGHLSALSSLEHLDIRDCEEVTDAGLVHLSMLPLQSFYLAFRDRYNRTCPVTDAGLAHLSKLPLKHLVLKVATQSRTLGWLTCLSFLCNS